MNLRAPPLLFVIGLVLGVAGCRDEEEGHPTAQTTPVAPEVAEAIQRNAPGSITLPASASANDEPAPNTMQIVAPTTCNSRTLATCAAELAWDAQGKARLDPEGFLTALVAGGDSATAIEEVEKAGDRHLPKSAMKVVEGMAHVGDWTALDQLAGIKGADAEAIRRAALARQLADHHDAAAVANLGKLSEFPGARSDVLEGYLALRDYGAGRKFVGNAASQSDQIAGHRQLAKLLDDRGAPQQAAAFSAEADELASKNGLAGKVLRGAGGLAGGAADWVSSAAKTSAGKISDMGRSSWTLATDWASSDRAPPKLAEVAFWKEAVRLEGYEKIGAAANPTERAAAAIAAYDLAQNVADEHDRDAAFARVVPMLTRAGLGGDALNAATAIVAPKLRARTAAQLALDLSARPTDAR